MPEILQTGKRLQLSITLALPIRRGSVEVCLSPRAMGVR